MKVSVTALIAAIFVASPVYAEKPAWAGKADQEKAGMSRSMEETGDRMEHERGEMENKHKEMKDKRDEYKQRDDDDDDRDEHDEDREDDRDDERDEYKDDAKKMKTEAERKELGKGSEQGQKSREEHSRKWWKFWE